MQETPRPSQQAEAWPPPPVSMADQVIRAPFFVQDNALKAIKFMAALLALLWVFECVLRWQSITPTVIQLTWIYDIVSVTASIAMTILFLRWVYAVEKNRKPLGRPAYQLHAGMGCRLFLYSNRLTLQAILRNMVETWKTSNPFLIPHERETWAKENPTTIVSFWWAFVLLSNLVSFADGFNVQRAARQGFAQYHATVVYAIIAVAIDIAGLIVTCRMVDAVNTRQNKAHQIKEIAFAGTLNDSPYR